MANAETFADADGTGAGTRILSDLQLILETTGVGMWSYDGGSNTFTLDDTCRELFDLDVNEELSFETLQRKLHPDDLAGYWQAAEASLKNGNFSVNYRVICRDGTIRFISGRGYSMPTMLGEPPVTKGVCIDMTEKQKLEDQLVHTEDRMQQLADGMPGLFSYIDRDYCVRFMSSQYRQIFGRSMDDLLGRPISAVVGEHLFAERKDRYDDALAGKTVVHEGDRLMPDGTHRYFTITHQPHRNREGEVIGVMTLAIDITDRRRIEEDLERKSEELSRSNQDLEQFAYVASHDLKAPLRAIELLVEWLKDDLGDYAEGEVQENLGLLAQRTGRLSRLLDDLLSYSRAGRKMGQVSSIDTRELVEDIATLLAPPAGLAVEADASLPEMRTHHIPLEQVFRNLINNAIKHHPTKKGHIRVSAKDQGDAIMFAVEDDGAGIAPEYAEKVFQMFQTLQPRDEKEGSGMGLAIVKRIVDLQGGRIWFHDGPAGKGTVFKFIWKKLDSQASTDKDSEQLNEQDSTREHSVG